MAARKRSKVERELDLKRIADYYLQGKTQTEIGGILGLDQSQICNDLKVIKQRWQEKTTLDLDEKKRKELDRIDLLETTYWAAWERSLKERVKTRTRKGMAPATKGQLKETNEASVERENLIGNPAFLSGVMTCIERRCKLLGLDAPTKLANTDPEGTKAIPIMVIQPGYMAAI